MPTQLASQYTQRTYSYTQWKGMLQRKKGNHQWELSEGVHTLWFYDGPEVLLCQFWEGTVPPTVAETGYDQTTNDADKADFLATLYDTANRQVSPKLPDGTARVSSEKTTLTRSTQISHDWCDPTTWYSSAVYVPLTTLARIGGVESEGNVTGAVYALGHTNIIDTYHGKITNEDFLLDAEERGFRVGVTLNGAAKLERDPHVGSGGDYVVDYVAGTITFPGVVPADCTVQASFHYATTSTYVVRPTAGHSLKVDIVEVQFSDDLVMNDTVRFEVFGYVDVFAPALVENNIVPSGTKIPLGNPFLYKTLQDFMNDSFRAYPAYPALGGPGWRGSHRPVIVFDWDYLASITLLASAGMEIRVSLEHDAAFGGSVATATFYCLEDAEA